MVLPRRSSAPLLGRLLLHDRTADKIARLVSRIPRSAAIIIPFDVSARIDRREPDAQAAPPDALAAVVPDHPRGVAPRITPIVDLTGRERVTVDGRVHSIEIRQVGHNCILACTITDPGGEVTALFYGRREVPGLIPGSHARLRGTVSGDHNPLDEYPKRLFLGFALGLDLLAS